MAPVTKGVKTLHHQEIGAITDTTCTKFTGCYFFRETLIVASGLSSKSAVSIYLFFVDIDRCMDSLEPLWSCLSSLFKCDRKPVLSESWKAGSHNCTEQTVQQCVTQLEIVLLSLLLSDLAGAQGCSH